MSFSEDDIDDLLYFARTGEQSDFGNLRAELCKRENATSEQLFQTARDQESGNGVLHMAAANGHSAIISEICKLLSTTAPQNPVLLGILNAQNLAGNTALHWAALNGHLESVKVLLDQGADPTITNQSGHDAVYEAELNDKTEVVEWVLKEGGEGLEEGVGGDTAEGDAGAEDISMAEGSENIQDGMEQMGLDDTKS